jgi:protein-L-isoaspartate(D-aspartate) O-methyltransferase
MPFSVDEARRYFAEDLRVTYNLTSARLVDAIASVPRERFLPPGPWTLRGPRDMSPRQSDDADPRHLYHDVGIAIDLARNLFNGQPSLITAWLESVRLDEGQRVLHIGCGTGYYTAWIAHMVGSRGRVFAMDVDPTLAERSRANLADYPWVEVSAGDATTNLPSGVDVIVVHAGATHILPQWLDIMNDGGRLLLPLTCEIPGMAAGISKGMMLLATREGDGWSASCTGVPVAIYSLIGARDPQREPALGKAMMDGSFVRVKRLRRDPHEPDSTCCVHAESVCLST